MIASSITQGGFASRPGITSTAKAVRELQVPIINLGFPKTERWNRKCRICWRR
ncbi:MAG: SGNH/GDSL hydrolase family protein [Candidatus Omnitrophota bacterium]